VNKLIYILILISLASCANNGEKGTVIATVYDTELYASELEGLVPAGSSEKDSLIFVSVFINDWIQEQTILNKAISVFEGSEKEQLIIAERVNNYKNSLIIYNFEKRYVAQHLDTIVKYTEIEDFYNANKKEFTLKDDIVQVAFLKFFNDEKNLKQVRKHMKSYKEDDVIIIKTIAKEKAVNYLLDENTWVLFDDLVKEIPIQTYNKSLYLKNNKYIELKDSTYTYMLRVNKYRIRNNYSPLSFEDDHIRRIIINIRKMEMVEQLHKDIFEEAQKNGKVRITKLNTQHEN